MRGAGCLVYLALTLAVAGGSPVAAVGGEVGVSLGTGFDSNPLRMTGDGPNGPFSELRADGRLELRSAPWIGWFGTVDGRARVHDSGVSNADARSAELRVGAELTPNPHGTRPLVLALGGAYGTSRSVFTDRATGGLYRAAVYSPADPAATAAIPARFDADTTGAFADLRWNVHRRMRLWLRSELEQVNFVDDYREYAELGALDYRGLLLEPGVLVQLSRISALGVSVIATELDHAEQPALDASGAEVPGALREYRSLDWTLTLRLVPQRGMNVRLGLRGGDRDDTHAGFYDTRARGAYGSFDWAVGPKGKVAILASLREVDYANATVPGTSSGEMLGSITERAVGRFDWQAAKGLGLFAEAGLQRSDNQSPLFTYGRNWVMTGIQYRRHSARDKEVLR